MKRHFPAAAVVAGILLALAACNRVSQKKPEIAAKNDDYMLRGAILHFAPGTERSEVMKYLPKPAMTDEAGSLWYLYPAPHREPDDTQAQVYLIIRFKNNQVASVEHSALTVLRRMGSSPTALSRSP